MNPSLPPGIVVLRPGALGDGVAVLPALESLSATCPEAQVVAIGSPVFRMAAQCGLASSWMPFDDLRLLGLFAQGGTADVLRDCDLCLAYTGGHDPRLESNLRASGARRVVMWPSRPGGKMHIVDHLLGAVEAAGLSVASRCPRLPPREEWIEEGRALLDKLGVRGRFVAIHPGSGGRRKMWPAERFEALAQRLDGPVVWLLGPAEAEQPALRDIRARVATVVEQPSLTALAGILASCRTYVGNDSGVSHLAAALGTPTVAIFGPTDPVVWGPRGERVALLGGPARGGLDAVTIEAVAAAAQQMMSD